MTWPLSTDEGPDQKRISQTLKATKATLPIEEITKQDLDLTEKEAQAAEITQTGTTNTAISVSSKGTDKRSAGVESKRTNLAKMPKDEHTGQESTSWRRIRMPNQSMKLISQRMKHLMMWKNTDLT